MLAGISPGGWFGSLGEETLVNKEFSVFRGEFEFQKVCTE